MVGLSLYHVKVFVQVARTFSCRIIDFAVVNMHRKICWYRFFLYRLHKKNCTKILFFFVQSAEFTNFGKYGRGWRGIAGIFIHILNFLSFIQIQKFLSFPSVSKFLSFHHTSIFLSVLKFSSFIHILKFYTL